MSSPAQRPSRLRNRFLIEFSAGKGNGKTVSHWSSLKFQQGGPGLGITQGEHAGTGGACRSIGRIGIDAEIGGAICLSRPFSLDIGDGSTNPATAAARP